MSPRRTKFIIASLGFSVHSAPHNEICQGFMGSRVNKNHWLAKMNKKLSIASSQSTYIRAHLSQGHRNVFYTRATNLADKRWWGIEPNLKLKVLYEIIINKSI